MEEGEGVMISAISKTVTPSEKAVLKVQLSKKGNTPSYCSRPLNSTRLEGKQDAHLDGKFH